MEKKVLTQEEIQQLNQIQQTRLSLIEKYGLLEFKIQSFLLEKDFINKELKELQELESKLGNSFQSKYGDGTIDLDKGEFIPTN